MLVLQSDATTSVKGKLCRGCSSRNLGNVEHIGVISTPWVPGRLLTKLVLVVESRTQEGEHLEPGLCMVLEGFWGFMQGSRAALAQANV